MIPLSVTRFLRRGFAAAAILGAALRPAAAAHIKLEAQADHSLYEAGKRQTTYLKVGLSAEPEKSAGQRPPINAALVLDKSGSMGGAKIEQAKQAAIEFVSRLRPDDIVSVIAYDSTVEVLVPATKAVDKGPMIERIRGIQANSGTGLYAGVCKGAAELRKFIGDQGVSRMILLSDGQANEGPSSPEELAGLGRSLAKEGIGVTTIGLGLGFNEELMSKLAKAGTGNYAFIENERDLAEVFKNELGAIGKILVRDIMVRVDCAEGVRPVRMLGRDAKIEGQVVTVPVRQIYQGQEVSLVLEVEIPEHQTGQKLELVRVVATYKDLEKAVPGSLNAAETVKFTASATEASQSVNDGPMTAAVAQLAQEQNELALKLVTEGKIEEGKQTLANANSYLSLNNSKLKNEGLATQMRENSVTLDQLNQGETEKAVKYNPANGTTSSGDVYRVKQ